MKDMEGRRCCDAVQSFRGRQTPHGGTFTLYLSDTVQMSNRYMIDGLLWVSMCSIGLELEFGDVLGQRAMREAPNQRVMQLLPCNVLQLPPERPCQAGGSGLSRQPRRHQLSAMARVFRLGGTVPRTREAVHAALQRPS